MAKFDYKVVNAASKYHVLRKHKVAKLILWKVKEMESKMTARQSLRLAFISASPWTKFIHSLDKVYYSI